MIELPELPYSADALAPVLSSRTLHIHHDKHHAKYVETVNALIEGRATGQATLEELLLGAGDDTSLAENGGQAWNHAFFWNCMTPVEVSPGGVLSDAIATAFGDLAGLRRAFIKAGSSHFGSGWIWLVARGTDLAVETTHDGGTLAIGACTPLLVCDLWEHAYYLDHQNDRAGFLEGWWDKLANWEFAEAQFRAALGDREPWAYDEGSRPQPLRSRAEFERALEGVTEALANPPRPRTREDRRLTVLLEQVADYHATRDEAPTPADRSAFEHFDRQLRAFEKRWPKTPPLDGSHWASALGGDVRPAHP